MSGRERILARLRDACRREVAPPEPESPSGTEPDWEAFGRSLEAAGGRLRPRTALEGVRGRLEEIGDGDPPMAEHAARVLRGRVAPGDPAELDGLPLLVATGSWALAATGSVAVDHRHVPVRARILLPERIVLLVGAERLVGDLPELYRRIDRARRDDPGYLALVTGPSKTADIGRVLVRGAHGPRAVDVVSVDGLPQPEGG